MIYFIKNTPVEINDNIYRLIISYQMNDKTHIKLELQDCDTDKMVNKSIDLKKLISLLEDGEKNE